MEKQPLTYTDELEAYLLAMGWIKKDMTPEGTKWAFDKVPRIAYGNAWGFEYLNFFCILRKYPGHTLRLDVIGKDVVLFDMRDEWEFRFQFPLHDKHQIFLVTELLKSIHEN
jgi:hypothetical protein